MRHHLKGVMTDLTTIISNLDEEVLNGIAASFDGGGVYALAMLGITSSLPHVDGAVITLVSAPFVAIGYSIIEDAVTYRRPLRGKVSAIVHVATGFGYIVSASLAWLKDTPSYGMQAMAGMLMIAISRIIADRLEAYQRDAEMNRWLDTTLTQGEAQLRLERMEQEWQEDEDQ